MKSGRDGNGGIKSVIRENGPIQVIVGVTRKTKTRTKRWVEDVYVYIRPELYRRSPSTKIIFRSRTETRRSQTVTEG